MLLWLITGIFTSCQASFITLLNISPFSLYLSPLGTMSEMIILVYSFIRDLAASIMRLDMTFGVSSNERSFVPTCNMYKSGLKSLLVGLV